jgi:hypothetical protein
MPAWCFDAEGMQRRPSRRQRLGRLSDGLARRAHALRRPRFSRGMERHPKAPGQEAGGRLQRGHAGGSAKEVGNGRPSSLEAAAAHPWRPAGRVRSGPTGSSAQPGTRNEPITSPASSRSLFNLVGQSPDAIRLHLAVRAPSELSSNQLGTRLRRRSLIQSLKVAKFTTFGPAATSRSSRWRKAFLMA